MKSLHTKLSLILLIPVMLCGFSACTSAPFDPEKEKAELSKIEKMLDVKFPPDARIVLYSTDDRNNELSFHHIIFTSNPVTFKIPAIEIPIEPSIKGLKQMSVTRNPGKPIGKWAFSYEGEINKGSWSVVQSNFETGSYLDVQQFYF